MLVAVGITVFMVALEMFIVTKVSVKCTNCKFSPCKYTWLSGSCGDCLEAPDSIFPGHFVKILSEAPSRGLLPAVSYRNLWQRLVVDSWVGSQALPGSHGSSVTAIVTALHMVVVPGHTC